MLDLRRTLAPAILAIASLAVAHPGVAAPGEVDPDLTPAEAREIAEEAYIYAYPLLRNYADMYAQAIYRLGADYRVPFNEYWHAESVGDVAIDPAAPNLDVLASVAWLDLRVNPVVLTVPRVGGDRYVSFQLTDLFTNDFAYISPAPPDDTIDAEADTWMIVGPRWNRPAPPEIDHVINAPTDFALCVARTQVLSDEDLPAARRLQQTYKSQTLVDFLRRNIGGRSVVSAFVPWNEQAAASAEFIRYVNAILQHFEIPEREAPLLDRFARIGIAPAEQVRPLQLPREIRAAIDAGVADALARIKAAAVELGDLSNGWRIMRQPTSFLERAAGARVALDAPGPPEIYRAIALADDQGAPLDGSQRAYTLAFDTESLPPADAFWSITLCTLPERALAPNAAGRHTISSADPGLRYIDGALTIRLAQEEPSEGAADANRLPAPDGPFMLMLRLYEPGQEAIDGTWTPPAIERVD